MTPDYRATRAALDAAMVRPRPRPRIVRVRPGLYHILAPDCQIVAQSDTFAAALGLLRRAERQPSPVSSSPELEN